MSADNVKKEQEEESAKRKRKVCFSAGSLKSWLRSALVLFTDVFIPEFRMFFDECRHEVLALRIVDNHQPDSSGTHVVFRSAKRTILTDHNLGNSVQQH